MFDPPLRPAGPRLRLATTLALALYWLTMFVATHAPKIPRALQPQISDKWQHYLAYAILGALLTWWWSQRRKVTWRAALGLFAAISLYGAFDESTQPLFGRESELLDWRADLIGAATGVGLIFAAARHASRQFKQGDAETRRATGSTD